MGLENLSLTELLGLASVASALLVALYLLDRPRRHLVAATLRFWSSAAEAARPKRLLRVQQPWSLVLQVASVLLLLAALAGLRWSSTDRVPRDHVILLDTSSWMAARGPAGSLLDEAKAAALCFFIIQNHPFLDGNKRCGHAAMETFLVLNGKEIDATIDEIEGIILQVASGKLALEKLIDWLKGHTHLITI